MKVLRNFIWLLASSALILSCSESDNNTGRKKIVPVDDGGNYTETVVTINRNGVKKETAVLRFYSNMDGVPYISVSDFHKVMMPNATMKVTRQGDLYEIATTGGTAMIDVKADRFTTSSIISIFDMIGTIGADIPSAVSYDGSPYIKPKERLLLPETSTVTFDFKKYSIDLHDDGSNVYFPYATLADIYSDMNLNTTYYNDVDKELEVSRSLDFNNMSKIDPNRINRIYGRPEVTDAMAKYRYNELCFVFDYIYGYPGRKNELFQAGMEQCGFDAALDKVTSGTEVKKLLQSKDNVAFILGMDGLQYLSGDGGHTNTIQCMNIEKLPEVKARYANYGSQYPGTAELVKAMYLSNGKMQNYTEGMMALRQEYYGSNTYIVSSDKSTAVVVLNSFMDLDFDGWKAYYASQKSESDWETLLARNGNALATMLSAIRQARKDGVKNIIIDLTLNTGGSSDIALAILSLATRNEAERQQVTMCSDYVLTKQASTTNYLVDRNFDGKFDAEDAKVDNSDLNFFVLTSNRSFSCANYMPSIMKDSGFKIMGQRSGGGSCAVQQQYTPDGMLYYISCYRLRMLNAKRENIDVGVPIDIDVPYEKFYDIDYLAGKLK